MITIYCYRNSFGDKVISLFPNNHAVSIKISNETFNYYTEYAQNNGFDNPAEVAWYFEN